MSTLFDCGKVGIDDHARRALLLNYTGRAVEMVFFLANTVVMARVLTPHDFGVLAMISPILWILIQFGDLGLASAALQERDLDAGKASVLLSVNLVFGSALGLVFYACSGLIGEFYGEPDAAHAAAALSLVFFISGSSAVQIALLRRSFRYGALLFAQCSAAVASFLLALVVAWQGGGYWALVARAIAEPFVLGALVWILAPWRPRRPVWMPETRRLLRYGAYHAASSSLNAGGRQLDHVLIGSRYGSFELGQYALAYRVFYLPVQLIAWPLGHVMVPTLSRLRDDPQRLVAWYAGALSWVGLVASCLFLSVAVSAPDVVAVIGGPQWGRAGDILRIVAPVGAIQACLAAAEWLLQSHGRSDRAFRLATLTTARYAVAFGVGLPWGGPGVACGLAVANLLLIVPSFAYAVRGTSVAGRDVVAALLPVCLFGGVTALTIHVARVAMMADWGPWARPASCAAIGAAFLGAATLWRLRFKDRIVGAYAAGAPAGRVAAGPGRGS